MGLTRTNVLFVSHVRRLLLTPTTFLSCGAKLGKGADRDRRVSVVRSRVVGKAVGLGAGVYLAVHLTVSVNIRYHDSDELRLWCETSKSV